MIQARRTLVGERKVVPHWPKDVSGAFFGKLNDRDSTSPLTTLQEELSSNADLPCKLLAPAEKPNRHTLDVHDFALCESSKTASHSMVHTDAQRLQDQTMPLQQARALFHFQRMVLSALARSMAFLEALQGKEVHTLLGRGTFARHALAQVHTVV